MVQFTNRAKSDCSLEKAQKNKNLTTADITLDPSTPIYVNQHLCPGMKRLFGAANGNKKDLGWKFALYCNGKIFVRKSVDSLKIAISHLDDLQEMT